MWHDYFKLDMQIPPRKTFEHGLGEYSTQKLHIILGYRNYWCTKRSGGPIKSQEKLKRKCILYTLIICRPNC